MGSVHDGGVFALPPHRRRALSGPQREWLPLGRRGPRARASAARAETSRLRYFSRCLAAHLRLQRQLTGLNLARLGSLHHVRCIGDD